MRAYSVIGSISKKIPEGRAKSAARRAFYRTIYVLPTGKRTAKIGAHTINLKRTLFGAESPEDFKKYPALAPISRDAVVIDVGAFMGTFTIYAALAANRGHVISIEPDSNHIKIIGENLKLNKMIGPVSVVHAALSNTSGRGKLEKGGSSTSISKNKTGNVRVFTGDDLVKKLGLSRVDLIKMNIEGAEIEAIEGFKQTIAKWHPTLIISADHIVNGVPTHKKLIPTLEKAGYEVDRQPKDLLIARIEHPKQSSRKTAK